ncbi:MAG: hypothetical protein IKY90_02890 [Oscillospiraceae bacterium]|nr:hypothetical protein [Oscillospiraceae bacterium]
MNFKLIIKYVKILSVTAILFLGGLYFADRLVTPVGEIEEFYDEPKNSIDVLIVGGSHTMCSVSATSIYDNTGLTAYNLSTWSQPVWVSYHYIVEALKYQNPQIVILDAFGSFYDRSYFTGVDVDLVSDDFAQLMKPSLNLLQLNLARRRVQVTKKVWEEYLNITKYHTRITELTEEDWQKIFIDNSTPAKGYGPFYTKEDFSGYEYPVTTETRDLYPYAEEYLLKIINLCKEKGIKLALVKIPHIADENDIMLVNTIHRIAEENGVDFLDYNSSNVLELDFSYDWADHGHLNNYGAKKATEAVSNYINTLGVVSEHSDEIINRWNIASEFEHEESTRMEIKLAESFDVTAERVEKQKNTSLILVKQDGGMLEASDVDKIYSLFEGTMMSMDRQIIADNDLFVYTDGSVLVGQEAYDWCNTKGVKITAGSTSEVIYNDDNYSFGRYGINAAMYSDSHNEIYHYISYAKEHDYTPYTR